MAYDQDLCDDLRENVSRLKLAANDRITERKMFGGFATLLNGNMLAGVIGSRIVLRLSDEDFSEALTVPGVSPMDFTGKPMRNFAYLDHTAIPSPEDLIPWLEKSLRFVRAKQAESSEKSRSPKR